MGMGNTQSIDFVIQGPGTDAELFCGILLHPKALFEDPQDEIHFLFRQGVG
jgi:hypothetical protein